MYTSYTFLNKYSVLTFLKLFYTSSNKKYIYICIKTDIQGVTGTWGWAEALLGSWHINAFCTSHLEKLWRSNSSCHVVPSDALQALFYWTILAKGRWHPPSPTNPPLNPTPRMQQRAWPLPSVQHSEWQWVKFGVPWQCAPSGLLKSPWAAGRSHTGDSHGHKDRKLHSTRY